MGIRDILFGSKDVGDPDQYKDITSSIAEIEAGSCPALIVKVATVTGLGDSKTVKDEIYDGNMVIVDISRLKMDKITFERVMKDFSQVARDVDGDIVGLGEQHYVVVTPRNVKISRDRIGGGA